MLQPIRDRLQSGLIDIEKWLIANKVKLSYMNESEATYDDLILYHHIWEDMYRFPYYKPSNDTYDYFETLIRDKKTSSDTFAHIIKAAYENLTRFTALYHEMDAEEITTSKEIKTMKKKTEELIRIINDNVSEVEISHIMLRNIYELIVESLAIHDPDPFSGLHDACTNLKRILIKKGKKMVKKFLEPPQINFKAKHSSLLQTLEIKGKAERDKANGNLEPKIATDAFSRLYQSDSDLSFGQIAEEIKQDQKNAMPGDLFLEIRNTWIEIDPVLGRLVNTKSPLLQNEGILCADYAGKLMVTSSHFMWYGIPKDLYHRANELKMNGINEMALAIPFNSIEKFVVEVLPGDFDCQTTLSRTPSSLLFKAQPIIPPFVTSKAKEDQSIRKLYYLSIYTCNETYRMFPLSEKEINFTKDVLMECAGIRPSFQDHLVRQLLVLCFRIRITNHFRSRNCFTKDGKYLKNSWKNQNLHGSTHLLRFPKLFQA